MAASATLNASQGLTVSALFAGRIVHLTLETMVHSVESLKLMAEEQERWRRIVKATVKRQDFSGILNVKRGITMLVAVFAHQIVLTVCTIWAFHAEKTPMEELQASLWSANQMRSKEVPSVIPNANQATKVLALSVGDSVLQAQANAELSASKMELSHAHLT